MKHLLNVYLTKKIFIVKYEHAFRAWLDAQAPRFSVFQVSVLINPEDGSSYSTARGGSTPWIFIGKELNSLWLGYQIFTSLL